MAAQATFERAETPLAADAALPAYRVWGGEWTFRFNHDLLAQLGARVRFVQPLRSEGPRVAIAIADRGGLEFIAPSGALERFSSGELQSRGGFVLDLGGDSLDMGGFVARARAGHPRELEIADREGRAWFTIDRLMHALDAGKARWNVSVMDLRIGPALARRLGNPHTEGLAIADVRLASNLAVAVAQPKGTACPAPNWPGSGGGSYVADVQLESITVQMARCRRSNQQPGCDGDGGDDGEVVLTPDTYLRNTNDNNGGAACTPGDPCSADVPWYTMFQTGTPAPPYGNDQHPLLIWNMYRIDSAGRIEQIGRSGLKHAFATANEECAVPCTEPGSDHILRRNCGDPYNLGSNDWIEYLGPRAEIVPAAGLWGRCGSVFDANCDAVKDATPLPFDNWVYRLIVRESQIEPALNPGAQYFFEAMYVVRDDVNVYNTMGRRGVVPTYGGGFWSMFIPPGGGFTRGPVLDLWVDPLAPSANARNEQLVSGEGRAKVAVRVTQVSAGEFRYEYAVMNVDFARAVTQGAEPNLRVLSSRGFASAAVSFPADVIVTANDFGDSDQNPGNQWVFSLPGSPASARWQAPAGNTLDWGSMYRFSFVANAAPVLGTMTLGVAEAGSPASYNVTTLVPTTSGTIFANGFE